MILNHFPSESRQLARSQPEEQNQGGQDYESEPESDPGMTTRDYVSTALTVGGGAVTLLGGLSGDVVTTVGGLVAYGVGSAIEAYRVTNQNSLDGQARFNLGVGGALSVIGLGLFLGHQAAPPQTLTPAQELIQKHPALGNLLRAF